MQDKPNDFGLNYGNKKDNEKAQLIDNMKKESERLKEDPKIEIHIGLVKMTLKKISITKVPCHDGIYGFWFKNSPPFTTD